VQLRQAQPLGVAGARLCAVGVVGWQLVADL
jgi:hypothetical protein